VSFNVHQYNIMTPMTETRIILDLL
jgi:hypothetical protein